MSVGKYLSEQPPNTIIGSKRRIFTLKRGCDDLLLNGYIRILKENELSDSKKCYAYDWLCEKGLTEQMKD